MFVDEFDGEEAEQHRTLRVSERVHRHHRAEQRDLVRIGWIAVDHGRPVGDTQRLAGRLDIVGRDRQMRRQYRVSLAASERARQDRASARLTRVRRRTWSNR